MKLKKIIPFTAFVAGIFFLIAHFGVVAAPATLIKSGEGGCSGSACGSVGFSSSGYGWNFTNQSSRVIHLTPKAAFGLGPCIVQPARDIPPGQTIYVVFGPTSYGYLPLCGYQADF